MTTNTYYSSFYPTTENVGKKGTTKAAVPSAVVGGIQGDIVTINNRLDNVESGGGSDTIPPGNVTAVSLSSTLTANGVDLTISFTGPSDTDIAGYDIQIKEGSGPFIGFVTTGSPYKIAAKRNTSYTVQVRAFDKLGNKGAWSSLVSGTTSADTTPPSAPSIITVDVAFTTANVRWSNGSENDLAYAQVTLYNASGTAIDGQRVAASVGGGNATWTRLSKGTTYKVAVQIFDSSGNASASSAQTTFTMAAGVDVSDFTPGLSAVKQVSSLPSPTGYTGPTTLFNQSDSKLYTLYNGTWVTTATAGAFSDLSGTIGPSQILPGTIYGDRLVAGTISTAQLASEVVTARVLAIGNPDNVVTDSGMFDDAWWVYGTYNGAKDARVITGEYNFTRFKRSLQISPNGGIDVLSKFFPVEPGATYKITVGIDIANDFSGVFQPILHLPNIAWYSLKSGAATTPNTYDAASTYSAVYSGYNEFYVTASNDVYGRQWQFRFCGSWTGSARFSVKIVRVSDTTLIKDGAITTDKIIVNSLLGDRIFTGSLDASKITAQTISTNQLSLGLQEKTVHNLLSSTFWGTASMTTDPSGNWSPNNDGSNSWILGSSPSNGTEMLLKMIKQPSVAPAGGWNVALYPSDGWSRDKAYRYYSWVNCSSVGGNNTIYHGCDNVQFIGGGDAGNPYFFFADNTGLSKDKWYLMVGVIQPANSNAGDSGVSGLYDPVTGRKVISGIDYRWRPTATFGYFRSYQYYGSDGGISYFTKPVVEEIISGQTSSISALMQNLNYASNINSGSTQIFPGLIQISGGTSLANWRQGGDETRIAGGSISANTVTANKLTIGNRGITTMGIDFSYNRTNGYLSWTSGYVFYNDDNNNPTAISVNAGTVPWQGGTFNYIWFTKGSANLSIIADNWTSVMNNPDNVLFCTWLNGYNFTANYGGTIVDGDRITTGSIQANRITTPSLSAISGTIGLLRTASSGARLEIESNQIRGYYASGSPAFVLGVQ